MDFHFGLANERYKNTLWVKKKLGHFYFYCNFVKCWPILIIFSLSEPEIISAVN